MKPCDELVIGIDPDRNIDATPLESKALVRDNLGQHNSAPAIPQDVLLQMDIQDCCKNCLWVFFYFAPFFMSSLLGLKIILMQITCLFLANVGQKATKYLIPTPFPPRTFRPVFIFPSFFVIFTGCFLLCCVFLHKNNHSIHVIIYSFYLFCCPTKTVYVATYFSRSTTSWWMLKTQCQILFKSWHE